MDVVASYDIDGVIYQGPRVPGLKPRPQDIIITGRSFQEKTETRRMLESKGIYNPMWMNPVYFEEKTRESSGYHKAKILNELVNAGYPELVVHYEDDPVQGEIIKQECPWIEVIMVISDLVEKENVRHEFP